MNQIQYTLKNDTETGEFPDPLVRGGGVSFDQLEPLVAAGAPP